MTRVRPNLKPEQRDEIKRQILAGEKFEVIAMEFGTNQSTVTRIAHTLNIRKNDERIARRTAIKLHAESLILFGASPRDAAEAAGCTLKVARNVQRDMRKIAKGNAHEIKKAIEQRSATTCQGAR